MSKVTAIVIVIVVALLLVCGTTFAVMLYKLDFFAVNLTAWYEVAVPVAVATVGLVLMVVGTRVVLRAKDDRAAS